MRSPKAGAANNSTMSKLEEMQKKMMQGPQETEEEKEQRLYKECVADVPAFCCLDNALNRYIPIDALYTEKDNDRNQNSSPFLNEPAKSPSNRAGSGFGNYQNEEEEVAQIGSLIDLMKEIKKNKQGAKVKNVSIENVMKKMKIRSFISFIPF